MSHFLLLNLTQCLAQLYISGKIIDSANGDLMPFVHISFEGHERDGVVSDIDGLFKIQVCNECKILKFSFVGYKIKEKHLDSLNLSTENIIVLKPSVLNLAEVLVIAGENPAYRIIRNTIANRKNNHPENYKSFEYQSYNRAVLFNNQNAPKEFILDSLSADSLPFYFMMMESVAERIFKFPALDKETVLATRVSGFKNPGFAPLATAFQPFSFYNDIITVLDKEYINPISPGSIRRYEYCLEDTLYNNRGDSIFVISFSPRKGKTFEALKGLLYINNNYWAVEYVMAEPNEKSLLDIKFEQKYEYIDYKYWFPVQLNFELFLSPFDDDAFTLQGKSYLSDIKINQNGIKRRDFGNLAVEMAPDAYTKSDEYWYEYRKRELDKKEKNTYKVIDSLGKRLKIDGIILFAQDLPEGLLPLGKIALDLLKTIDYNPFEKLRLGLGLYNSSLLSKRFRIGGYFGYGFGDIEWKYGADGTFYIAPKKDLAVELEYSNDIAEPASVFETGSRLQRKVNPNEIFARRYFFNKLDYREKLELGIHFRLFRSLQVRPYVYAQKITPGYDYSFASDDGLNTVFRTFNAGLQLRWTYKEKFADFNGQRILVESRYPAIYVSYNRGFNIEQFGDFEYQRLLLGLELKKHFRGLGKTELSIMAGWTDRALPLPLLFNGRGAKQNMPGVYTRNGFQTMDVLEFISDRFIYAFWVHNFGRIPIKSRISKPEFKIAQSVGYGSLRTPLNHINFQFKTMEKGFFESGILLDNLLTYNAANLAYIGFGLGVFYRYGFYSSTAKLDNFAFNINLSFTL